MLVEFSLKHVREKFMEFTCLENALIRGIFTHVSLNSKLAPPSPLPPTFPSSYHHALGRRKLLIPSGSILSKICFPQQQKGEGNYDLLYQNSVKKYEDDFEH